MAAHEGDAIAKFRPEWLAHGGKLRYQMGLSIECPGHPNGNHRLSFWFANPGDHGAPLDWEALKQLGSVPRRFWRHGGGLAEITIGPEGADGEPIEVPGHWRGWIHDGKVFTALIQGVAW